MSFIDEVRAKRQKLADVLFDEDNGIRDIVEELYPDRAHFVYELLQNAEDREATTARFVLCENSISFEHDGKPFSKEDVLGITNIGKGTKKEQEDQIGRFGIGFKAVFAYSETPHIWSPTYSFKISELVLPTAIPPRPDVGPRTRFEFPFNNPKKNQQDAYAEVEAGLKELAETTLLFLSHLKCITWKIGPKPLGQVVRIEHSDNHIEIQKRSGGNTVTSSHFLRFSEPVEGLERQSVSVAFELDYLPNVAVFDTGKTLVKQLKIRSANPGCVAVFFPAEKETSGLRFHLHAPFVPELSRASIKETPKNEPLFEQLATLAAASLHSIRTLRLLTVDLLAVLPNPQDSIPPRYQPIRLAIVEEMNREPLTPTHSKSHAPAKLLLQAKAPLKDLLSVADLKYLADCSDGPPEWAIGATQKNSNADRFLTGLAIKPWDVDKFINLLVLQSSDRTRSISKSPWTINGPDPQFISWLGTKAVEWHQQLYSLLYKELSPEPAINRLKSLNLVRLSDGSYSAGSKCYFPTDGVEHDLLPRVDRAVYSSGKSKTQQEEAKKLLEEIGVHEVGEKEHVEGILKQRYTRDNFKPQKQDLKRFIELVENDSHTARLFEDYYIFEGKDGKWRQPRSVFLDQPFMDTGLAAYYNALGERATCVALAPSYEKRGISIESLVKFAKAVGIRAQLEVTPVSCSSNPGWPYLSSASRDRYGAPIDRDCIIEDLEQLLAKPSVAISKLVWRTMSSLPHHTTCFQAEYGPPRRSKFWDNQLVLNLRTAQWVPQAGGSFARPAEASRDSLPDGFTFDPGWTWLKAIHFGEELAQKSEAQRQRQDVAKTFGFADAKSLERAQRFATLPQAEQERILAEFQGSQHLELPEHESRDPKGRAKRVGEQAAGAPKRISEHRQRAVPVGRGDVKQEAEQYLRGQYTNECKQMFCQVCEAPLPFKLEDGFYYCEKVEFFEDLKRQHYQNYLSLCPNHGAMFQYANGSRKALRAKFVGMDGQKLEVVLAKTDLTVYFTKTHIADLKTVIEVDQTLGAEDDAA
jgi:hypothetical protein